MTGRIIIDGVDVGAIRVGPATFLVQQPSADALVNLWSAPAEQGKSVLGSFTAQGKAQITFTTRFGRAWMKQNGIKPPPRPSRGWRRHQRRMKARAVG